MDHIHINLLVVQWGLHLEVQIQIPFKKTTMCCHLKVSFSLFLLQFFLYKRQSNENRTPATKWQWNLFYSKVTATSVNTFIPLGDATISSSFVERGRLLMDPQPHPLLLFLVQMKPMSTNVSLQVAKNVEVTRGKIWAVRRMLKCFPANLTRLAVWGWAYHAKGWFCPTAFQGVLTLTLRSFCSMSA